MLLQYLEQQFQLLGTSLHLLADCINYFPFFVTTAELEEFNQLNVSYQEFYNRYLIIVEGIRNHSIQLDRQSVMAELQAFGQANDRAHNVVANILHRCAESIKPEITINTQEETINIREYIITIIRAYELLQRESTNPPSPAYAAQKQALEKQFANLLGMMAGIQDGLSKALQLSHVKEGGIVEKALKDDFDEAKELQHDIYSAKKLQTDFSCLRTGFIIINIPTDQFLPKEGYIDLVSLTHLLKPECVCQALENKLAILQFTNTQLKNKIQKFSQINLTKLVRLQRIIVAYQDWAKVLQEQLPKITNNDLMAALFIQQLLTYDKKAFLTKLFQAQTLITIINALEKKLTSLDMDTQDKIYAYFYAEKNSTKQKIQELETRIRANQTYWQATLATALLGITRQPEYQLGQLSAALNVHFFDQFPTVPIIGEQLPKHLLNKLYHSVGLSFLSITMYVSSKFGYSYQFIAFINRILLAQIDYLIKLGSYSEQITQYTWQPILDTLKKLAPTQLTSTIDWIKEAICFDDLGVIEKERFIHWTAGLGIQTAMTLGHNVTPAILGYVGGTFFAEATGALVETYTKHYDCSETTATTLKVMAHFLTYSYAYSHGYRLGLYWLGDPNQMSQKQAFTIFGLDRRANEQEMKSRYRELALQYHPDRCAINKNCEKAVEKMSEINTAYELLQKKFV